MEEIWKDIVGYQGLYQISNYGRVKSLNYKRTKKEQILKFGVSKNNYLFVNLWKDDKYKSIKVHRLVALSFIPNIENKFQVNHKDLNKENNCVNNLEWVSHIENIDHAKKYGVFKREGEENGRSKLKESDVKFIRYLKEKYKLSNKYISELYDISKVNVSYIINKKIWKHI